MSQRAKRKKYGQLTDDHIVDCKTINMIVTLNHMRQYSQESLYSGLIEMENNLFFGVVKVDMNTQVYILGFHLIKMLHDTDG